MSVPLGEAASSAIRNLVIRGGYRAGDRLPPERELAETLGLSRPTVREATRRLIEGGLLVSRHGSGTYVAYIDVDGVFDVRLQLEPHAAALAARNRPPEPLARLAELVRALPRLTDDIDAFVAVDTEIHRTLAEASGNSVLSRVLEQLTDLAAVSRGVTSHETAARKATIRQLRTLVRAVRAGDPDAAAAAMEAHLAAVRAVAARRTAVHQPGAPLLGVAG